MKTLFPLILVLSACCDLLAGKPTDGLKRVLVGRPRIEYPESAKRQRISGSGIYLLHVDAAGNVTSADVTKSAGSPILDDAAIRSFKKDFKFKPGTAAKVPVPVTWYAPGASGRWH